MPVIIFQDIHLSDVHSKYSKYFVQLQVNDRRIRSTVKSATLSGPIKWPEQQPLTTSESETASLRLSVSVYGRRWFVFNSKLRHQGGINIADLLQRSQPVTLDLSGEGGGSLQFCIASVDSSPPTSPTSDATEAVNAVEPEGTREASSSSSVESPSLSTVTGQASCFTGSTPEVLADTPAKPSSAASFEDAGARGVSILATSKHQREQVGIGANAEQAVTHSNAPGPVLHVCTDIPPTKRSSGLHPPSSTPSRHGTALSTNQPSGGSHKHRDQTSSSAQVPGYVLQVVGTPRTPESPVPHHIRFVATQEPISETRRGST